MRNKDFGHIPAYYAFYFDENVDVGRRIFCHPFPVPSKNEIIKTMMILELHGLNPFEVLLCMYLRMYKEYVRKGMQRKSPFHKQMKKEIKSLIDKVESGII